MAPEYLNSRFVFRNDITYQLRNTENKLALPQPRINQLLEEEFILQRSQLVEQPTLYLVTLVQQHLYKILNLTYVTTVLNEFYTASM